MGVYIPEKLKIFVRGQTRIERTISGQKQMVLVRKAFATDADKPKTHETAERWAKARGYKWDAQQKRNVATESSYDVIDRDNKPFDDLKIYNIECRSEGGRAYKVQTKEGWAFDVREDCILDTIIEGGIREGGFMSGEFIWVKDESQMKITRVGSELYKRALAYHKVQAKPKIKNKDLVRGGIYTNAREETYLFLGKHEDPKDGKKKLKIAHIWLYGKHSNWTEAWKQKQRKDIRQYEKALKSAGGKKRDVWRHGCSGHDPRDKWIKYQGSHSFIDKLGQLTDAEIAELIHEDGED